MPGLSIPEMLIKIGSFIITSLIYRFFHFLRNSPIYSIEPAEERFSRVTGGMIYLFVGQKLEVAYVSFFQEA
jgi:hypothetical protein